jgi:flagellar basal body-associated protein FliL
MMPMMDGPAMWAVGLVWILVVVVLVLVLGAAALVKYLFFGGRPPRD